MQVLAALRIKISFKLNKLLVAKGERGGVEWEFGISRCKLLYTEWMINKVLLYNMGNYILYPVINHNGKGWEKECIYLCISESLCCTVEVSTTL